MRQVVASVVAEEGLVVFCFAAVGDDVVVVGGREALLFFRIYVSVNGVGAPFCHCPCRPYGVPEGGAACDAV